MARTDTVIDLDAVVESVETETGVFNAENVWEARDADHAAEQESLEEWNKLSDTEREVIADVVGKSLSEMHDRLPEWLPHGLEISRGGWLKVSFRLLFSDLEDEVNHQVEVSERKIAESAEALERVLADEED